MTQPIRILCPTRTDSHRVRVQQGPAEAGLGRRCNDTDATGASTRDCAELRPPPPPTEAHYYRLFRCASPAAPLLPRARRAAAPCRGPSKSPTATLAPSRRQRVNPPPRHGQIEARRFRVPLRDDQLLRGRTAGAYQSKSAFLGMPRKASVRLPFRFVLILHGRGSSAWASRVRASPYSPAAERICYTGSSSQAALVAFVKMV